jgi:galactokinase
MRNLEAEVTQAHRSQYGCDPAMFSAPGRVNLIGEHTDYSDGFVLPAAINFRTVVGISQLSDEQLSLCSVDFQETVAGAMTDLLHAPRKSWSDYPVGVLRILADRGVKSVEGCNLTIAGDVPLGAGLSSSASLEVATAMAVTRTFESKLSATEIALACQAAENSFVGANCGIMDQFIAMNGEADHALLIDCRALTFTPISIPANVKLIICNSMVSHSIAGGEYNTRRSELEQGTEILRRFRPAIRKLRDAREDDFVRFGSEMPEAVLRRCRHVVSENRRVLEFAEACRQENLARMGTLMNDSYVSYRDDFEASCPEVEVLVQSAQVQRGCYGSRLTGGGFGGCTVSLVETDSAHAFQQAVHKRYLTETGINAEIYCCTATDGAIRNAK